MNFRNSQAESGIVVTVHSVTSNQQFGHENSLREAQTAT